MAKHDPLIDDDGLVAPGTHEDIVTRYCNRCGKPRPNSDPVCECGCGEFDFDANNPTAEGWRRCVAEMGDEK